jgi:hypothetical protein
MHLRPLFINGFYRLLNILLLHNTDTYKSLNSLY